MNPEITATRRVELAVGQCESISILPAAAARFLGALGRMELTPVKLGEIIACDPAITALLLRLCCNKGITIKRCETWISDLIEGLSLREIRDAVLSAKIIEDSRGDFRRKLTLHSLAVASCAEMLAKQITPPLDEHTAYLAGLLHDIGKFLLDEAMPKSFDTLLEQAREKKTSFALVEQENIGLDHTILGKRFAQKLELPGDIILGVWLHHSQTGALSKSMPQARIASVVELADSIVRKAGIGESGNYDKQEIAGAPGLGAEQIIAIAERLPELVRERSESAGLNLPRPLAAYCEALRVTTGQLAQESSKLFEASGRLESSAGNFDFVSKLLPRVRANISTVELAGDFAVCWQKFYQTGPVCLYLVGSESLEGVVVDKDGTRKAVILDVPKDATLIPPAVREKFDVIDASDYADWLLEQVEVEFDPTCIKLAPLQSTDKIVGVIVFELRHPVFGDIEQRFAPAARFGAVLIDMLQTISQQQWYAERFAQAMTTGRQRTEDGGQRTEGRRQKTDAEALAEMAAGAAHELNNPLSVIRGRSQLLAESEIDPDRKRILEQIGQNASELSLIIDDLMSYATPEQPIPTETAVGQIIKDASDLTIQKKNLSGLDIKIDVSPETPGVVVDSAQVSSAISNIICNGLESYEGGIGPIEIKAAGDTSGTVNIEVVDKGRGMDEQTLAKATQPFFSARPAGRKRGMGLAHAKRLIEINHGTLELTSQLGKGTRVKVTLPCRSE